MPLQEDEAENAKNEHSLRISCHLAVIQLSSRKILSPPQGGMSWNSSVRCAGGILRLNKDVQFSQRERTASMSSLPSMSQFGWRRLSSSKYHRREFVRSPRRVRQVRRDASTSLRIRPEELDPISACHMTVIWMISRNWSDPARTRTTNPRTSWQ